MGRTSAPDEDYADRAEERMTLWKAQLESADISKRDLCRLKNKISSLKSRMENKKLFDETEFAMIYLQEYIHSNEESYNEVINMVTGTGVTIMEIVEVRLEDDEPRTMLKDTGGFQKIFKISS